jgi:hypothetical protein
MGCTMCADKADEAEHKLAAEKAARQEEEKKEFHELLGRQARTATFEFKSEFDENGAIHFLGTLGNQRVFENPGNIFLRSTSS